MDKNSKIVIMGVIIGIMILFVLVSAISTQITQMTSVNSYNNKYNSDDPYDLGLSRQSDTAYDVVIDLFERYDTNKDDKLDYNEFIISGYGSESELGSKRTFNSIDRENSTSDGYISPNELWYEISGINEAMNKNKK
ncbi:MAG: hypothetical protein LBM26_02975 [Methanobrevibacter sp.]|jgi:hypothetical protein|nr:hypothetical protein [Methanobrevibacter sp.]